MHTETRCCKPNIKFFTSALYKIFSVIIILLFFYYFLCTGTQSILTVSKISVQKHQTIIIPCLYDQKYVSKHKYVSSGGVWSFSREVKHNRMSFEDNQTEKVFTATLRSAEESDTGSYWCAISTSGSDPHAHLYLEVIKGILSILFCVSKSIHVFPMAACLSHRIKNR